MLIRRKGAIYSARAQWPGIFYPRDEFHSLMNLERKRIQRSKGTSVLMLVDVTAFSEGGEKSYVVERIISVLRSSTREIDLKGWYRNGEIIGILFTQISDTADTGSQAAVARIAAQLSATLDSPLMQRLTVSCRSISEAGKIRKPVTQ